MWNFKRVYNAQSTDSVDATGGRADSHIGRSRIWRRILDHCFDNADRRQYGMNFAGRLLGQTFDRTIMKKEQVIF